MADQLYLSLWFPNFRLESLPAALTCVLGQLARVSGEPRVSAAATYPISFSEAPTYQRLYVTDKRAEENQDTAAATIESAVAEATEQLHDDVAYEFEMRWNLWTPDSDEAGGIGLDPIWRPKPTTVRILGFGPEFDEGDYEQNGHIRVDFGLDYPWTLESEELENGEDAEEHPSGNLLAFPSAAGSSGTLTAGEELAAGAQYIRRNVEMLLAFHPLGRKELRYLKSAALDRIGRAARGEIDRPATAPDLKLWADRRRGR